MYRNAAVALIMLCAISAHSSGEEKKLPSIGALKPFNALIGKWNAAGVPEGTLEERNKGHWAETLSWEWQFKGDDAWIVVIFEKGKYFKRGELRHLPKENTYQFRIETIDKQALVFLGTFTERNLSVERTDDKTKETQRLVFSLLHFNRIVYRYDVKPADKTFYTKLYRVGATKDGEPLVITGFNERECIVSGGTGTSPVMYQGKIYYVCCSGCRDEFNDNAAKYVAEFEKKRAAFDKKK